MNNFINVVIPPLNQAFTYGVPPELSDKISIGDRVLVPFGSRQANGFVISNPAEATQDSKKFEIKEISPKSQIYKCFNQGCTWEKTNKMLAAKYNIQNF